jgi:hypothetical protein
MRLVSTVCVLVLSLCVPRSLPAEQGPADIRGLVEQARAARVQCRFAEAEGLLVQALGQDPRSAEAHLQLARTLLLQAPYNLFFSTDSQNRVPRALDEARAANALAPTRSDALSAIGSVLYRMALYADGEKRRKLLEESRGYHEKALEKDAQNFEAHDGLAEAIHFELMETVNLAIRNSRSFFGDQKPFAANTMTPELRQKFLRQAGEGMAHARAALVLRPRHGSTLQYEFMLTRVQAYLSLSQQEFAVLMKAADELEKQPAASTDVGGVPGSCLAPTGMAGIITAVPSVAPPPPKRK